MSTEAAVVCQRKRGVCSTRGIAIDEEKKLIRDLTVFYCLIQGITLTLTGAADSGGRVGSCQPCNVRVDTHVFDDSVSGGPYLGWQASGLRPSIPDRTICYGLPTSMNIMDISCKP